MRAQQGSVLFYILIAVVLFAALGFAVSGMMRGGGSAGNEKNALLAAEILDYAKTLRQTVQTMKIAGQCDETRISFERNPFDGSDTSYVNAAAPSDFSCHVYHTSGGGVGYRPAQSGEIWAISGSVAVDDTGSASEELTAFLHVNKTICEMINTKLDVSNASVETAVNDGAASGNSLPAFQGSFISSGTLALSPYSGKLAGCYKSSASSGEDYTFYQVLAVR